MLRSSLMLITLSIVLLAGCGGGSKSTQQPVSSVLKGYARVTINWWNYPDDSSTLRSRYIPSTVDRISVVIYDKNNNVANSGVVQRPNSELVLELIVDTDYIAKVSGYDRNNNLIGEGMSDRFSVQASTITDVRVTILGVSEPSNNNSSGSREIVFSNNQGSIREIFHTSKDNIDWFRFNTKSDKAYTVHFSVLESSSDSTNWRVKISVYDANNNLLKESSSPGDGIPPSPLTISKPSTNLLLKVEVTNGTFKGWYQIDVYQLDLGSAKVTVD